MTQILTKYLIYFSNEIYVCKFFAGLTLSETVLFCDRISLYSPGCSPALDHPVSASQVLGLQASPITSSFVHCYLMSSVTAGHNLNTPSKTHVEI
jgi:hypothetical protein